MTTSKLGLILAAGNGSRLASVAGALPKPLVQLHGKTLLEQVLLGAYQAGIHKFVIVLGYRGRLIRSWFEASELANLVQITWVENHDYNMANGISVLKTRDVIDEPFTLFMSDHIFEPKTAAALIRQPLGPDEVILAVDHKLDSIFDTDDATKVVCKDGHVVEIGKQIKLYNAIDTGMFLCAPSLFDWLEASKNNGNCSLSDGMRLMAEHRKLRAFDIGDAIWQDVDTPDALAYARDVFSGTYNHSLSLPEVAGVR